MEEFLRRLEQRVFICCKGHKLDFAQPDQIKLRSMESLLTGRALGFWKRLSPSMRNSYELAAATLEGRFPEPFQRAIIEMNSLIRGSMTLEDHADRLSKLHSIFGDRYASILIGKLREGLTYNERQQPMRSGRVLQVVLDLSEAKMRWDSQDSVRLQGEPGPASSHPSFIPVAAIPKAKKTKTRGESKPMEVTKVVQCKEQPSAEVEILAKVVEPIEKEVAIEEVVVVIEPGDAAIKEVVVVVESKEQAMAEIPAEVVEPIEEEVAIEEVVVVIEPGEQAMKEVVKVEYIEVEEQEVV